MHVQPIQNSFWLLKPTDKTFGKLPDDVTQSEPFKAKNFLLVSHVSHSLLECSTALPPHKEQIEKVKLYCESLRGHWEQEALPLTKEDQAVAKYEAEAEGGERGEGSKTKFSFRKTYKVPKDSNKAHSPLS